MEKDIVELICKKEYAGLYQLIDYLGADVIAMINCLLNRPEERIYKKEVENETFYKIWKKAETFDNQKSSLKTWCLTIARNTCLDKKRKLIRESSLLPLEQIENGEAINEKYFEKEEFLSLVQQLSSEDQLIFLKYYFYQDSPKEIAEELRLDVSTIYNRLSRGRNKLRQSLNKGEI